MLEKYETEQEKENEETIITSFLNNLNDLDNKYHKDEEFKRNITYLPIFRMLDIDVFFQRLLELRPSSIRFLTRLMKSRYPTLEYREEAAFIMELNRRLCDYLNLNKGRTRINWVLNEFQKNLEEVENKHGIPVYT